MNTDQPNPAPSGPVQTAIERLPTAPGMCPDCGMENARTADVRCWHCGHDFRLPIEPSGNSGELPDPNPPQPAPAGSAVEWVKELLYKADGRNLVLDEDDARELAQRCDRAEKELASVRTMFRHHSDQLAAEQRQFGLLKGELHTTKAKLAAAERRVERLREELWNIVNANPRQWGDQADQFEAWAKNRARAALAETKEGASNE